ncbi:transposase family protein [Aureivirga sp. CE67]|uniref:transposase family protein n=1 Tax=Aureivirga sp. CE67 TaxID=1788983 RepID=UPI0018CB7DFF
MLLKIKFKTNLTNQKEEYSGKKKIHTMKYLAIENKKGYIHFLSSAYFGTVHDKKFGMIFLSI